MIRENQRLLNQFNVLTDAVAVFLAMLVSYWLRFELFHGVKGMPFNYYVWLGVVAAALTLLVFAVAGLYESFRAVRFHVEAGRVAVLELLVALIVMAAMFVLRLGETSRWSVAFFYAVATLLLVGKRGALRMILRRIPLDNLGNAFFKRAVDVVCSLLLIVLTSPLMLIAAIGVKLSSPGPIIFKQERVGKDKKPFYMYKFRSMKVNSSQNTGWSKNVDDRKTWFGSLIRKCSVDELPQFFNVLKGDMSLIGPRPELPFFVEQFKEEIPRYMVKHQVRPGITGWAQVNGFRGDTSITKRIEFDLYYIENWSPAFDLRILLMTAFCMFNKEKINAHRDDGRK